MVEAISVSAVVVALAVVVVAATSRLRGAPPSAVVEPAPAPPATEGSAEAPPSRSAPRWPPRAQRRRDRETVEREAGSSPDRRRASRSSGSGRAVGSVLRDAPGGDPVAKVERRDRLRLAFRLLGRQAYGHAGSAAPSPAMRRRRAAWIRAARGSSSAYVDYSVRVDLSERRAELLHAASSSGAGQSRSAHRARRRRPGRSPSPTCSAATSTRPTAAAPWR